MASASQTLGREVRVSTLAGSLRYVLGQDTLLSQCLSPPKSIHRLLHGKCAVPIFQYSRVAKLWKTHSFAPLTCSFSKVLQRVNKNPYKALSML